MGLMHRRHVRRLIDLDLPLYAQKEMTIAGVEFEKGDEIDWREFEIPAHTLHTWFRLRMISHHPEGDLQAFENQKAASAQEQLTPDDIDDTDDVTEDDEEIDTSEEEASDEEEEEPSEEEDEE